MDNARSNIVILTGATGFIGSRLAMQLVQLGWEVHAVVRPSSNMAELTPVLDRVAVHQYDGTMGSMLECVRSARPHVAIHLASLFLAQHQVADIDPLIRSNVLLGTQFVEALSNCGCKRLINVGTSWQHYENRDFDPVCLYAATKQAFEMILRYYTSATSMKTVTLKLFDTYGPGDPRKKLFYLLRQCRKNGQPLSMSPGGQLVDLVYVDDVVEAFLLVLEQLNNDNRVWEPSYAVSSGRPIALKELVGVYERVVSCKLPITWGGRSYRPREVMAPWNTGKSVPGWTPKVSLEEGIRRVEEAG